ncbi:hypothetical protein [Nocardia arizonensis]|uniref:hypothetical protein n=1 Tax=Nocardia arizonensis TaxID=1141647 RepID=UPI0006D15E11|nr:hypothetical protein [Nocardia arizonensis]
MVNPVALTPYRPPWVDARLGSSTSGTPDSEFAATADWNKVFTPSYDAEGNQVGLDIATRNTDGLYDNVHVDNYDNITATAAVPDGHGGVVSTVRLKCTWPGF